MADEPAMLMPYQGAWVTVTVRDMLRERDARLAALERENAAYREIVAEVAAMHDSGYGVCVVCGQSVNQAHYGYGKNEPHNPGCTVPRARALLATQTPATGATALYTDHADHEHDWQPIENRTMSAAEGHLIVWYRTRCRVCSLISEMSINPWQTPGTVVVQSEVEPAKPNDHTHEWESAGSRTETTDDEGNYHKWYRARCAHCGLIWEHS